GKLLVIEKHGVWWPNVSLFGGYSRSAQEQNFEFQDYYWIENLYAGVSLNVPLFDGFRSKYRAQEVTTDIKRVRLQREQLVRGINLEIIQAQNKLNEALKNVRAQEEGVALARKGLEISEVRYQNGLATQLEVMDAQVALNQAKTNELSARYDAVSAYAELEKAMGR
ncbi:MAG: TolC family protein, partial [bacterium]